MDVSITVTRQVRFCAGHRLHGHESKCRNLHGHNYVALLTAKAIGNELDALGRVVDFAVLKQRVGGWIDAHWDHGFIVHRNDAAARAALEQVESQKTYVLDTNPTAENLALHLLHEVGPLVLEGTGVKLVKVVLQETETCSAEVASA